MYQLDENNPIDRNVMILQLLAEVEEMENIRRQVGRVRGIIINREIKRSENEIKRLQSLFD